MTYREIVHLILDELKITSDDSIFNQDHVIFLLGKYRAFLLKQRYTTDIKRIVPESNYQTICLDLKEVPAISGEECEGGSYLRSVNKIPTLLPIGNPKVYPIDYYQGNITYISRERMRYVGYNKWLSNIIYCSLGPDNYLYFKSSNPQYMYLEKVRLTGVFEDIDIESSCEEDTTCDILDKEFPIEAALTPAIIELVVKELRTAEFTPTDEINNADDTMDNINMKTK